MIQTQNLVTAGRPRRMYADGSEVTMPDYLPGQLVVRIKADAIDSVPGIRGLGPKAANVKLPQLLENPLQELRRKRKLREVIPIHVPDGTVPKSHRAVRFAAASLTTSVREATAHELSGINLLKMTSTSDLDEIVAELNSNPAVHYAHRVPARRFASSPLASYQEKEHSFANRQWALRAIGWYGEDVLPDSSNVEVAVLDTGLDLGHPEFNWFNKKQYHHSGLTSEDIVGHGTHVAGIIAGISRSKFGVQGVCSCDLHCWKIFGDVPLPDGEHFVDEVLYQRALAAVTTMRVVNLSIGSTQPTRTEEILFGKLNTAGVIVVAAMGNDYSRGNPVEYPAAYPNLIAVGSTDEMDRRSEFSSTGPHISLCAPGSNILSALPQKASAYRKSERRYGVWSGTSMATPYVTAAVALLIAKEPNLLPSEVKQRLEQSASKLSEMGNKDRTNAHGYGLLNIRSLLN